MRRSIQAVFLILCVFACFKDTNQKNLFIHAVEYDLSGQKVLSMATVNLFNEVMPTFIMLEPQIQLNTETQINNNNEQFSQAKRKSEIEKQKKKQEIRNFHEKLPVPIKVVIQNSDSTEQQCLFDEPWDLCLIEKPKKSIDFSVHCLLQENEAKKSVCKGKVIIRQADLTRIPLSESTYQQKIKYESGLFSLPQLDKHSVMLISCQDDDLPQFSQSLKIYSTLKYHRYEREDSEEVKDLVGFDKSSFSNKKQESASLLLPNQPLINDIGMDTLNTAEFIDKTKSQLTQSDINFVYLDVQEQLVRKCIQFQFYGTNEIINERQVFDYLNLTDNGYKNVYEIFRRDEGQDMREKETKNEQKSKESEIMPLPLFKYNMQLTLNVFKPQNFYTDEAYDIRIKLLNKQTQSTHISYTIPFALSKESAQHTTSLYSRTNHYHFTYVVGNLLIRELKQLQVEIEFQARLLDKSKTSESIGQKKNDFFFISLSVEDAQHVVVEKLMHSYLSIKKDDHITFLIQEPYQVDDTTISHNINTNDLVEVKPSSKNLQVKLSQHLTDHDHKNQCHYSKGCKFQVDALNDCLDCRIQYKASLIRKYDDMLMLEIKNQIFQGKIDLDETQYFYKELKPSEVIEFIISTPNIIVFTLENQQDFEMCKIPKKSCHTQVATSHEKIILSNPSKENNQIVYFAVEGLDKTRFTILLLISNNIVHVMNGMPFTYKLSKNKEEIELLFEVPEFELGKPYKKNLTFNLVAPLNSLEMDIFQLKEDGTELQAVEKTKTMAGFVKLSSKQVKSKQIKIVLTKTTTYIDNAVHFTFIPSTSDHKFRLDTGITHYEIFDAGEQKNYVIEFEDSHTYEISMHFYDSQDSEVSFTVLIFNPNEGGNSKGLNYKINSKDFTIILDDELIDKHDLCPENDPECSLFIMVNSLMIHEVEVSMTLLTADSVMELKDGVWETFKIDDLLVNTHFYFAPTHDNNPVKIFFKSSDPNIYLSALLYDNRQNVNPAQWPFPETHRHDQASDIIINENHMFKSNHLVQLDNDDPQFKKCFPHCVVLMSIYELKPKEKKGDKKTDQESSEEQKKKSFSILASNNEIELPQKMRLQLQLKQGQQQFIFVNLKHGIKQNKQMLTFFTNTMVGYAPIYANIYIPSLQNIPDVQDYEILFQPLKTQITIEEIKELFEKNEAWMEGVKSIEEVLEREELYLALLINAQQDTQLSLQYTTDYSQIKQLQIDSVETIYLQQNEQKLFQFIPTRDEKIRFIRTKGYPLFHQFKCQAEGNYNNCLKEWLERLRVTTDNDVRTIKKELSVQNQLSEEPSPLLTDSKMKEIAKLSQQEHFSQYQILKKTQTQHVIECQRCIVFIWIYALEQSQLTIQLQSLNTEILLKQNELLTDYIEPSEFHRYYLPRVQKEASTIIVSVNEGNPIVTVSDNFNYLQTKKSSEIKEKSRKVIVFNVPPLKNTPSKANHEDLPSSKTSSFNKIFSNLHISITTEDAKPVSYSITYSSGTHEMLLKNGVISTQFLFENDKAVFYYKNEDKEAKSYLTLTVESQPQEIQKILQGIEIKMYSLTMLKQTNLLIRNELLSEKPLAPSKSFKKQTTLTYEIPPFDDLEINIFTKTTTKITIGISNGKIIFLPLSYEYPVFLKPKQDLRFVIENLLNGHIEFVVKKCDQSNPYIFYTNDEIQFEKDLFSNYDRFGSSNVYRHVSRTKQKGSLYLKIKADPKENSLLLVSANYALPPGSNFVDLDPGNSGVIRYQFESLKQIKLNFTGLQCGKSCRQLTNYYLVSSKSLPKIYNELVCAGEQMIKLFEKQSLSSSKSQQQKKSAAKQSSLLDPLASEIKIEQIKILSQEESDQNTFEFVVPVQEDYPFVTIKAVYMPTGEQVYYKPIQIKSLKGSVSNYSQQLLLMFVGGLLLALALLVWITQKLSRKGYIHIGSEETMIV